MATCEIKTKYNDIINTISNALNIDENAVKEAVIRSYVPDNDETNNRLRRVLCKAARGEKITIAGVGGSITEGSHAFTYHNFGNNATEYNDLLDGEKCWFSRVSDWFKASFPNATIDSINAGFGATPSFLGVFSLEQMVLKYRPDLVTIDFSVNDPAAVPFLLKDEINESYEAIIRRCLELGIAVIPVFFTNSGGDSFQKIHGELANHYNLPAISYQDAIYPDGKLICDWSKLSPDNIHPNNVGHALLSVCVSNYLDNVLETTNLSADYPLDELHTSWIYFDSFKKTHAQYACEFKERAKGFEFVENIPEITRKWNGVLVSDNDEASIKLTVPKGAKRVYVQFFHSAGSFETKFLSQKTSCNTTAIGWPRAMWHRVYTGDAIAQDSEITIKTHKNGKVIIMGLLVAF